LIPDFVSEDGAEASPASDSHDNTIHIHYPTLYRSRLELKRQLLARNLTNSTHHSVLKEHTDSVYCFQAVGPWLITGGRDRSLRIWRLGAFGRRGTLDDTELVKTVENAHNGSVLSISSEIGVEGGKWTMITGSSDCTAGVWELQYGKDGKPEGMKVERTGTLRGHEGSVLDVGMGKERIVTWSVSPSPNLIAC